MPNRRNFLKNTLFTATGITLLPDVLVHATGIDQGTSFEPKKLKLRFAHISDGHYGQPGTDYKKFTADVVKWVNAEHARQPFDLCIINGDLVHDRPDLLPETKQYFDQLKMPYYTVPGNHDHATTEAWKKVWGYEDNHAFEFNDYGFIMGNTSNEKGDFLCPNLNFIKQYLDKYKSKQKVFMVLHIPSHQWGDVGLNCPDVDALFANYPNIAAVFHGHHHDEDGVKYSNGKKLAHFFDAHYGGNWGTDYKGYRIVEVDMQEQIYTYQYNASLNPVINSNILKG
jgi:hypothetical protein